MTERSAPTFTATIYIAGDIATARQACRDFCMAGLCVTVEPTEFIYKGGAETGVRVGLLNYPRFPAEPSDILGKARALADLLRERLCQHSWLIVTPDETIWNSTRPSSAIAHPTE
ncbi:hypothetical protein [Methylorubrum suomiense]|uniref:Uncharacterized protein n=1 Tax=Methylorubrum suomiense TaxID=144191 RepID=A0ABQ4UZD4_9HYPH|nr:hypothetical protein [Methylorubrum suomiense]GJE77200.1 hypothetical protein BGCPKDLD_3803 [Methylorubrum suomiense]